MLTVVFKASVSSPLDITAHLKSGVNNVRFIHLGNLSGYTFLLHAAEPHHDDIHSLNVKLASDWDTYLMRLKENTHTEQLTSPFKFVGKVTVETKSV